MVKQTVCPNCGGSLRAESHGWICNKCKGFISLQDGKFYEYVEKPFMPPMTNADRIRAMTDEELIAWAHNQIGCGISYFPCGVVCDGECNTYSREECDDKILKWLQQPAEGDA